MLFDEKKCDESVGKMPTEMPFQWCDILLQGDVGGMSEVV